MIGSCLHVVSVWAVLAILIPSSSCAKTCTWENKTDVHTLSGEQNTGIQTENDCLDHCLSLAWCSAVDWNPQGVGTSGGCFLCKNNVLVQAPGSGIIHHAYTSCSEATNDTITEAPVVAKTSVGCYWSITANSKSPNSIVQQSAASLSDCQTLCDANYGCHGFDWFSANSAGQQCYLSLTNSTSVTSGANGAAHYERICLVGPPSTLPPSIKNCWTKSSGTTSSSFFQPYQDLQSCQNGCLLTNFVCTGVDWKVSQPVGKQCYFSITTDLTITTDFHYSYNLACATTASGVETNRSAPGIWLLSAILLSYLSWKSGNAGTF